MMTQQELTQQESIDYFIKRAEQRIDDGDFSGRSEQAIKLVIKALRTNPCDNCVGPSLALSHGYTDMRVKPPEVE